MEISDIVNISLWLIKRLFSHLIANLLILTFHFCLKFDWICLNLSRADFLLRFFYELKAVDFEGPYSYVRTFLYYFEIPIYICYFQLLITPISASSMDGYCIRPSINTIKVNIKEKYKDLPIIPQLRKVSYPIAADLPLFIHI